MIFIYFFGGGAANIFYMSLYKNNERVTSVDLTSIQCMIISEKDYSSNTIYLCQHTKIKNISFDSGDLS